MTSSSIEEDVLDLCKQISCDSVHHTNELLLLTKLEDKLIHLNKSFECCDDSSLKVLRHYIEESNIILKLQIRLERNDKFLNHFYENIISLLLLVNQSNSVVLERISTFSFSEEFLVYSRVFTKYMKLVTSLQPTRNLDEFSNIVQVWDNQIMEIIETKPFNFDRKIESCFIQVIRNVVAIIKLRHKEGVTISSPPTQYCFHSVKYLVGKLLNISCDCHLLWKTIVKLLRVYSKLILPGDTQGATHDVIDKLCIDVSTIFLSSDRLNSIKIVPNGFCGIRMADDSIGMVIDGGTAKHLVIFLFKTLIVGFSILKTTEDALNHLNMLLSWLRNFPDLTMTSENTAAEIVGVFLDDDSQLNSLLLVLLRLFKITRSDRINPHKLFHALLNSVYLDESVLVDWLLSKEANFAEYFRCYINYANAAPEEFFTAMRDICSSSSLDGENKESRDLRIKLTEVSLSSSTGGLVDYEYSSSEEEGELGDGKYECDNGLPLNFQEIGLSQNFQGETLLNNNNIVDDVMACLIRIRYKIERLWSYLPGYTDVIKQLENLEEVYESNYAS